MFFIMVFIPRGVQGDTSICVQERGGESIGPSGRPRTHGGLQERWRLPSVESSEFFPPFLQPRKKTPGSSVSAVRSHGDGWFFAAKVGSAKQTNQARNLWVHDMDSQKKHSKGSFDILLMEKTPAPLGMFETLQIMGYGTYQLLEDFFHQQYPYVSLFKRIFFNQFGRGQVSPQEGQICFLHSILKV